MNKPTKQEPFPSILQSAEDERRQQYNNGKKVTLKERNIIQGYVMLLMAILYRG